LFVLNTGHEALDRAHLGERRLQVGEVLPQRLAIAHRDRADADGAACDIGAGHPFERGQEVRVVAGVEPGLRRLVPFEARQPVGDIGRIARFRHLAVIDDVDADLGLAADDREDCLARQPFQLRLVIGLALILLHQ